MAAVEMLVRAPAEELLRVPVLRLVERTSTPQPLRQGPSVAHRRAARAQSVRRRHRALAALVVASALAVLSVPGHVFGATTGAGLSTDLAGSSVLASGMNYVVQPGDTLNSIARAMNSVNPARARTLLVRELHSKVVVAGEHVLIP